MKIGRRLSGRCRIGYVSVKICALLASGSGRTGAYFDRNESDVISRTGTLDPVLASRPN